MIREIPSDEYLAGFADGEGCFYLNYRKDVKKTRPGSPVYHRWFAEFRIALHGDDEKILEMFQKRLNCGHVNSGLTLKKWKTVQYYVSAIDDLEGKVIPFFDANPLYEKKRHDFQLWKEGVHMLYGKKGAKKGHSIPWTEAEKARLENILSQMQEYKTKGAQPRAIRLVGTQK